MLVPALTVPVSLTAAFIVLWAMGFSVNLLTLLALVLSIGLVVDDAIVVLENVYRRVEASRRPRGLRGARQVGFAVIATTLVLVRSLCPSRSWRGILAGYSLNSPWLSPAPSAFQASWRSPSCPWRRRSCYAPPGNERVLQPSWTKPLASFRGPTAIPLEGCFGDPSGSRAFSSPSLPGDGSSLRASPRSTLRRRIDRAFRNYECARGRQPSTPSATPELENALPLDKEAYRALISTPLLAPALRSITPSPSSLENWDQRERSTQEIVGGSFLPTGMPGVRPFPYSPRPWGSGAFPRPCNLCSAEIPTRPSPNGGMPSWGRHRKTKLLTLMRTTKR